MTIHQIQVAHDEAEDRLLLRLSTTDNCEFRFWLTRRFTTRLWKMLVQMLEWDRAVKQQVDPRTRHDVLDLQHEGYAREADYKTKFREHAVGAPPQMPLGPAPLVLTHAQGQKRDGGVQVLKLHPVRGNGIDITVDSRLLHLFMRLLREQVARTDWDIDLALHEAAPETPRVMN